MGNRSRYLVVQRGETRLGCNNLKEDPLEGTEGAARSHAVDTNSPSATGHPQMRCAMLSNRAYCDKNASRAVSVGPFRCLATITSAIPRTSGDASLS